MNVIPYWKYERTHAKTALHGLPPGNYAHAFLEGRLTEADLLSFRQQASRRSGGRSLPSYPHPRQMDDFWEFPTVSLGIGPVNAIYQAWYNRYLHERGIKDTSQQHVWSFMGDGEMDEAALEYALEKRAQLGGFLPERRTYIGGVALPAEKHFDALRTGSGKQKVATTMALVRLIKEALRI